MPGKCTFKDSWLTNDAYKAWLQRCASDKRSARCSWCMKNIDISNMGEAALKSHARGSHHVSRNKLCSVKGNPPLSVFFNNTTCIAPTAIFTTESTLIPTSTQGQCATEHTIVSASTSGSTTVLHNFT